MNYKKMMCQLIGFLFIINLRLSVSAMEFASQEIVTEKTKLVNSQNFEGPETFIPQLPVFEQTPLFSQDIWRKILYKWTPASDVDTKLQWNVGDAYFLSLTCKGLYQFVNSLETYAIIRDTLLFRALLTKFTTKRGLAPEGTPSIIRKMKVLKTSYNDIEKRNLNQAKRLRASLSELDNLSELHILKDLKSVRKGIDSTLSPIIKSMLTYAKENPEGCTKGDIVVDLADLSHISGIPLPPYEYDARRDYKRIFRNKCLIIGGTVLLGSLFLYEGMILYNQYPQAAAIAEGNRAFAAMLNQTSKEINYWYWRWGEGLPCFERYWFSQSIGGTWWNPDQYFPNGSEPGYCYFSYSQGICFPANMAEWIQIFSNKTGLNSTFWLDRVLSIVNGQRHDTRMAFCSPNADGISISCGSAYSRTSQDYWNTHEKVNLQLTRGDAVCAYNMAHDLVIRGWRTMMGLYWGFGSVGSLLFVYLWLLQFLL